MAEDSDVDLLLFVPKDGATNTFFHRACYFMDIESGHMMYVNAEYRDPEFTSVYVRCRFTQRLVNVFLFRDKDVLLKWVKATEIMKNIVKADPSLKELTKDKYNRVYVFEALKHIQEIDDEGAWFHYQASSTHVIEDDDIPF